jgi:hypothetical protein
MFKHKLIALILVVTLLFGAVLPAWADSFALGGPSDTGALVRSGLIHPMGGCSDGGAGGCNYG